VEDDADSRTLLTRYLKGMSEFTVLAADGFESAIAAAKETEFDLMLIDIGLAGESGVDLLKQLLETRPCRAIALTGYGSDSDISEYKKAGFAGCIIKPIDVDQLMSTMRETLRASPPDKSLT
jgi:DNA-binding response OmpR family regulator